MSLLTIKKLKNDVSKYDINIYISDRAGRKSSVVQDMIISEWVRNDYNPIALVLRKKSDELINENWFSEYIVKKYNQFTFYNKKLSSHINAICCMIDEEEKVLFFNLFVSLSQKYKSSYYKGFEYIKYVIYEECVPESRLTQNIDYINKSDEELNSVFSIASTVCRFTKPKYIFLGNDIEYNILNPVTVKFQILDRLKIDENITGKIDIYNSTFTYNFYYFSFKGSKNHWSKQLGKSLIKNEKINGECENIVFIFNEKRYFLYDSNNIVYISDYNPKYETVTEKGLIIKYFNEKVYNQYEVLKPKEKVVFLHILIMRNPQFKYIFDLYYKRIEAGNEYIYEFSEPENESFKVYNINEILIYNYEELFSECLELYNMLSPLTMKKFLYSNLLIKIYFEKLKDTLLLTFFKI